LPIFENKKKSKFGVSTVLDTYERSLLPFRPGIRGLPQGTCSPYSEEGAGCLVSTLETITLAVETDPQRSVDKNILGSSANVEQRQWRAQNPSNRKKFVI
jgi:hypothetical protein